MTLIITGNAKPEDARTYRLHPVEIPTDTGRITVRYQFGEEIANGSGIIDMGIFDPRGAEFPGKGFRGWSGSARREFTITHSEATPGYLPGPIQPGTWQLCLGLYEIAEGGCGYRVEVDLELEPKGSAAFPALLSLSSTPRPEKRREGNWYRGELHCHTFHSDGDSDPSTLIQTAEALGLDFLAITDHNVQTQQIAMRSAETKLILIPGMEVTTYYGHWNIWGDGGWLDFRVHNAMEMRRSMTQAIERGFLVSCNHPRPHGPAWEFPEVDTFHCIEVWNGPWPIFNQVALDFWESHLRAGRRYPAVGGSDTHFLQRSHIARLGQPTTYIYCSGDPSPAALLASLRAGRAFITESPQGPQIYLEAENGMMGDVLSDVSDHLSCQVTAIDGCGSQLQVYSDAGVISEHSVDSDEWHRQILVPTNETLYIRAQLIDRDRASIRALTNPIYISHT